MKKNGALEINYGVKALKISLIFVLLLLLALIVVLMFSVSPWYLVFTWIFKIPTTNIDLMAIAAGAIIFIAIPFLLGFRIGLSVKK